MALKNTVHVLKINKTDVPGDSLICGQTAEYYYSAFMHISLGLLEVILLH